MLQRQGLMSFLVFLLGIFLLYFIFWDSFATLFASYSELQIARKEKNDLSKLIDGMDQFKKTFAQISQQARPIFQVAPVKFDEPTYIITLQNILSKSGFILQSIAISDPDGEGNISITIGIAGNPSNRERLLKNLELALPLFEQKSITIGSKEDLQSTLSLESYIYVNSPPKNQPAEEIDPNKNFIQRLKSIEDALKVNLDLLNNDTFKEFRTNGDFPVSIPPKSAAGRDNPFDPF